MVRSHRRTHWILKRLSKKKKEFVDFLEKYKSVVVDDRTNINIPFMKKANK